MDKKKLRFMALAGVLAAMVFVFTAFVQIPIPAPGLAGYVHLGDAFVYLAACLLPMPWGIAAAAIGAGMADILTGYAVWAPGTLLIKALMARCFTSKPYSLLCARNAAALAAAAVINVGGYYLYECAIVGSMTVPLVSIPKTAVQSVVNTAVFIAAALIFDRVGLKNKLNEGRDDDTI
ncbi:MAG: TIGR04002 family protein [Eubacteriales bacterium]